MSEDVRYSGKLMLVTKLNTETLEEQCKRICNEIGYELTKWCDTYEELVRDELYDNYIILEDRLYKMEYTCDQNGEYFEANYDAEGNIKFEVGFYNGGCDLHEAIEEAYEKLEVN